MLISILGSSSIEAKEPFWFKRFVAYGICTLLAISWTLFAGKDIPWDAIHYHIYAGFNALSDRLAIDLFPAGAQTYFNPYSHVPLYLMLREEWPALAIGIAFAVLQSPILWMTWELARAVSRTQDGDSSEVVTWAAVGLALLNPVLLQGLGSSFNDISTGAIGLAGYVALVSAFSGGRIGMVAIGGVLLGAASALKLSNMMFMLLPAFPLLFGSMTSTRTRVRAIIIFSLCTLAGMLLVGAPWAWRLYAAFGNPAYPLLNGLFHPHQAISAQSTSSSGAPSAPFLYTVGQFVQGMRDPRFLPSTLIDAVLRPFDILHSRRMIHTETMAADVRYAALVLLGVASAAVWAWRRQHPTITAPIQMSDESRRAFASLGVAFFTSWVLWLSISGNSRYFVPMACLASVLLVAGMYRIFSHAPPRALWYSFALLFGVQTVFFLQATEYRWSPQRWDGAWLQVTLPRRLTMEPYLYLPMDSQSQSFLLPLLAPGSSMVGINSGITPESTEGQRASELIQINKSRLRLLKLVETVESDGQPVRLDPTRFDYLLRRFGLQVDMGDCDFIRYKGNPSVTEREGVRSGPRDQVQLYSCRVMPGIGLTDAELEGKRVADLVLDRVEAACPQLFSQNRGGSVRSGEIWRRNYADLVLWVNDSGAVRFSDLIRGGGDVTEIGSIKDWMTGTHQLRCWHENGRGHVALQ